MTAQECSPAARPARRRISMRRIDAIHIAGSNRQEIAAGFAGLKAGVVAVDAFLRRRLTDGCVGRLVFGAVIAVAFGLSAGQVTAQTIHAATAVDNGNWSSSAMWATTPTPGLVPNNVAGVSTFDVFVTEGYSATLDINVTIRNLTLGYNGGPSNAINGSGNLTVLGNLDWGNGTMDGTGTTTVTGSITGNGGELARVFNADGTANLSSLTLSAGGTWNNRAGAVFVMAPGSNVVEGIQMAGGTFNNLAGAELRKDGVGDMVIGFSSVGAFNNAGLFNVRAGFVQMGGNMSMTNSGLMTVAAGATVDISSFSEDRGMVNTGTIRVAGGTLTDRGGEGSVGSYTAIRTEAGTIDVQSGVAALYHLSSMPDMSPTGGDRNTGKAYIPLPGTFKVGPGGSVYFGQLYSNSIYFPDVDEYVTISQVIGIIPAGRGLTLDGATSSISSVDGSLISNAGTLEVLGGRNLELQQTVNPAEPISFFNTGTLRIAGGTVTAPGSKPGDRFGVFNNGFTGDVIFEGGKLVGRVVNVGDGGVSGGKIRGTGTIQGDVLLTGISPYLGTAGLNPTDNLTIQGNLIVDQTPIPTNGRIFGSVAVTGETRVTDASLSVVHSSSVLGGPGTKIFTRARLAGEGTTSGPVTMSDSELTSGGLGLTMVLTDTLAVTGGSNLIRNTVNVGGLTTVSGGTLTVDAGATFGGAGAVSVTGGNLVNNGTITKSVSFTGSGRLSGVYAGQVAITDGTVNANGGLEAQALSVGGNSTLGGGPITVNEKMTFAPGTVAIESSSLVGEAELQAASRARLAANAKVTGTITQGGNLNIDPTGTLDANTYNHLAGATTTIDGKLVVSQTKAAISGVIAINPGGEMELRGGANVTGTTMTVNGAMNAIAPVVVSQVAVTLDGTWTGPNPAQSDPATAGLVLNALSTLQGSGNALVGVVFANGSSVNPGNSPGKLTVGNTMFQPGSKFVMEVRDAGGAAGIGYDQLVVNGNLVNTGTSANPMVFDLTTLDAANNPGQAVFDPSQSYTWQVASVTGEVTGFTEGTYRIDTSHFQNSFVGGVFDLWANSGNGLILSYTLAPVPEPASVLGVAAAGIGLAGWARRRRAARHLPA